jgi:hypothetical protein
VCLPRSDSEVQAVYSQPNQVDLFCQVFQELLLVKTRLLKFEVGVQQKPTQRALTSTNKIVQIAVMVHRLKAMISSGK